LLWSYMPMPPSQLRFVVGMKRPMCAERRQS
jgi:hypothetical protein